MQTRTFDKILPEIRFTSRIESPRLGVQALTPLIDIGLLLLIFLLVGSSVVKLPPGVPIKLPELSGTTPGGSEYAVADKLVISYTRERLIFFADQPVSDEQDLENELIKAVGARTRKPVIILRADKELPYQDIVNILSITRRHAAEVYLLTDPRKH